MSNFPASRLRSPITVPIAVGSGGGCGGLGELYLGGGNYSRIPVTAQGPSNFTMNDIAVDGTAGYGILGSHVNTTSSDVITGSDIYLIGNGGLDGTATVEAAVRPANQ